MARPLRIEIENTLYHITSRGNERKKIFRNDRDRKRFLLLLKDVRLKYEGIIYAYVLMDNHYHLLLETLKANLSKIMHHINVSHTVYFNKKYRRAGHLFQGRYKALVVDKENYLLELSRYIHLNPVRVGIVKRPDEYKWSSYCHYLKGYDEVPLWLNTEWVIERFGRDRTSAFHGYCRFVEEGLYKNTPNPFKNVYAGTILGSNNFVEDIKEKSKGIVVRKREIPATSFFINSYTLEEVISVVAKHFGVDITVLSHRRRNFLPRKAAMYLAKEYTDVPLKEIADYFEVGYTAITQNIARLKLNKTAQTEISKIEEKLNQSKV